MKKIIFVASLVVISGLLFNLGIIEARASTINELQIQIINLQNKINELQGLLGKIQPSESLSLYQLSALTQSEMQQLQEGFKLLPASVRADNMLNFSDQIKTLRELQPEFDKLSSSRKAELELRIKNIQSAIKSGPQTWIAGYNPIYILSDEDQKKLCGLEEVVSGLSNTNIENKATDMSVSLAETPPSFDWRNMHGGTNYLTSVKDQGWCGSCWAFAAVGTLEGHVNAYYNNPNLNLNLSEQQLVSSDGVCCSACGSCSGGESDKAFDYIQQSKISLESCFPYFGDIPCNLCSDWQASAWGIVSWEQIPFTSDDIKSALITKGPLVMYMKVYSDLFSYKGGIYYSTSNDYKGNHAIILVGYGNYEGRDYWIIKNSWGSSWGESGYFRAFSDDKSFGFPVVYAINEPVPPTVQQAICTDNDGDGYCAWGLGPKPHNCPPCHDIIQDCDDSDPTIHQGCAVVYPAYNLSVTKAGAGQNLGTVTSNPSGINCGTICNYSFSGTVVLTASPSSIFYSWSGACSGRGIDCVLTMDAAKTVTANFYAAETLTITKSGSGSGRVTSKPSGIDCGDTCVHPFGSGSFTTLTATAPSGSTFVGWGGACSGTGGTCTVKMDAAKTVTATFNTSASTVIGSFESRFTETNQNCEYNDLLNYNASRGYKFTPRKDGQITHLCGYFDGSKIVKLYNSAYDVLASTSITTVNSWACTPIAPVSVIANSIYYVVVELGGDGACVQTVKLPLSTVNIVINDSVRQSPSGTFNAGHSISSRNLMVGMADVVFSTGNIINVTLEAGWNLFSPSVIEGIDISAMKLNGCSIEAVYVWDPVKRQYRYAHDHLKPGTGYSVAVLDKCSFPISGAPWYLSKTHYEIGNYLIGSSYESVKVADVLGTCLPEKTKVTDNIGKEVDTMMPFKAYWLSIEESCDFGNAITLEAGWNFFSPSVKEGIDISAMKAKGCYIDNVITWDPVKKSWAGIHDHLKPGTGYSVAVLDKCSFPVPGTPWYLSKTHYDVGNHLIGSPYEAIKVADVLGTCLPEKTKLTDDTGAEVDTMIPFKAYWLSIEQACDFGVKPPLTLTVNSSPISGISISSATGHSGTTNYTKTDITSGTSVSLTAPAKAGSYTFSSWTGCDSVEGSTGQPQITCKLTTNSNRTVTAHYTDDPIITLEAGWNLFSPSVEEGIDISTMKDKGCSIEVVYAWDPVKKSWAGIHDHLKPGTGYSVAVLDKCSFPVPGTPWYLSKTNYDVGNHLIGSPYEEVKVADVLGTCLPEKTKLTDNAGAEVDTMMPFKAYWLSIEQACDFGIKPSLTLTVNSSPISGISISSATGHSGTTNYTKTDITSGTSVSLTAPETAGSYTFSSWTGCDSTGGTDNRTCNLTMNTNRTVTANYKTTIHTFSVSKSGTGSGTVTSNPAGINCGTACSATYPYATVVTLTAIPDTNSTFKGWSGDCTGTETCKIGMTSDKSVTVTFDKKSAIPEGCTIHNGYIYCRGFRSTDPQGSSCNAACSARGYTCPTGDSMFRSLSDIVSVATALGLLAPGESYSSRVTTLSASYIRKTISTGAKQIYYNSGWNQTCNFHPYTGSTYESVNICRCQGTSASQTLEYAEYQLASLNNIVSQLIDSLTSLIRR